jgi:hypothetical protein
MGCDISLYAEKRVDDKWVQVEVEGNPFGERQYGKFGFLADVRNYSAVTPIAPQRGMPPDTEASFLRGYAEDAAEGNVHSASWLTIAELEAFNYDAMMEDRRVTRVVSAGYRDGGCTCDPGEGKKMTYREFFESTDFFESLAALKAAGAERVVFWFDS